MAYQEQRKAPLFDALVQHDHFGAASFHVPGHKSGQGVPIGAEDWFRKIMQLDLTEITGLDDLHQPEGVIAEAQELAADFYGAAQTYFLVGGSTVGNLALILSLCQRDDVLIVQRDVHKSVLHGLMLADAKAVFIHPRVDEATGLVTGVDPGDVASALRQYPSAKAVLLTSPSYYGVSSAIQQIAPIVHAHGKPLLIDEAHGAHFGLHPQIPISALQAGADAVVQSAHKMLNAMTMGAILHLQEGTDHRGVDVRICRTKVQAALSMLQSSSPSYPLMASLDLARREMAIHGIDRIAQGLEVVAWVHDRMRELPALKVITANNSGLEIDPFKLPIYDSTGTLSGFALQAELERRGCMVEMADLRYALLVFSPFSQMEDGVRLVAALAEINDGFLRDRQEQTAKIANTYIIQSSTPVSAPIRLQSPIRSSEIVSSLPLEQCVGLHSAELMIPYPPGIAFLLPGETITPYVVEMLQLLRQSGAKVQGANDPTLQTLSVYSS